MGEIVPKIELLRKKASLTQRELADLVGVTETTIANWENGRSGLDWFVRLNKLCEALECDPSDLYEERDIG